MGNLLNNIKEIRSSQPISVYVHWPYCESKCPYCDFNSHVAERIEHDRWQAALLREFDAAAERLGRRQLVSIFFGGGTPSLMPPALVEALIERITGCWPSTGDLEITLEANPSSVEAGRFQAYRAAGVNRVSLGVQALDDAALAWLGRRHSAAEALAALKIAHRHFERVSFDLIYARPGQSEQHWRDELLRAVELASGHLSVYQLTIEPGTAFAREQARGSLTVPGEDAAGALYETTKAVMDQAGMPAYEISNHAAAGQACRHNLVYWRYQDYVGIGPGAHGRESDCDRRKWAPETVRAPNAWLQAVEADGHGVRRRQEIAPDRRLEECLMMGLRLSEGIPIGRLQDQAGQSADALLGSRAAAALVAAGYLVIDSDHLAATAAGRQRLDGVLRHLINNTDRP